MKLDSKLLIKINNKLKTKNIWTWRELRTVMCSTQTSIADELIMDFISSGYIEPIENRNYRIKL